MGLPMYQAAEPCLKQTIQFNQEMLHSLKILQMPLPELREHLLQAITENPMLEMAPPPGADAGEPVAAPEISFETDAPLYRNPQKNNEARPAFHILDICSEEQTFSDILKEQIRGLALPRSFRNLCFYLVDSLNPRGYLDDAPEEIALLLREEPDNVMQALYLVQSLSPAGVGARSLSECLMLQLAKGEDFNRHTIKLVKSGLPLLAQNDVKGMAALLGTNTNTALAACNAVKKLNPIPSRGYHTGSRTDYILPDAHIYFEDGRLTIQMGDRLLPRLGLCREYLDLLETACDAETQGYLRQQQAKAKKLMHSVDSRSSTLQEILQYLAVEQQDFFIRGGCPKPLTMLSAAEELGVHPSTVSRAVNNKYISCKAGIVPLKALFSPPVNGTASHAVSASLVKAKLQQCIEKESPHAPLSDEAIKNALAALGISVSRRVVAKYRDALGIPSSRVRAQMGRVDTKPT